jgi:hypothetical protein
MPIILASQEAEIRMLRPVILAAWEAEIRKILVQRQPRQIVWESLSQNYPTQIRAGGVAQVVECHLASMRP